MFLEVSKETQLTIDHEQIRVAGFELGQPVGESRLGDDGLQVRKRQQSQEQRQRQRNGTGREFRAEPLRAFRGKTGS